MVRTTMTYTVRGREYRAVITRPRALTYRGAQRIVRRTHPGAIVTRLDAASEG